MRTTRCVIRKPLIAATVDAPQRKEQHDSRRPITFLASAAVIPLAALAVAACGGGGAATAAQPQEPSQTTPTPTATRTAAVRVASSRLGRILVNSNGRTLYLFKADARTKSRCAGTCATAWPPLLAPASRPPAPE